MADDNQNTFFGIQTVLTEENPNKNSNLFGSQANFLNQSELYANPAVNEALNLLELSLKKNIPDQFDINIFKAITRLIKIEEIYHLRPNITPASLDNLAKKSGEIEKISLPENSNEDKEKHKQQEEELAKLQKAVEEHKMNEELQKTLTFKKDAEDQNQNPKKLLSPKKIHEYTYGFLDQRTSNSQENGPQISGVDKIRGG
jgi:hypothetical protein